MCKIQGTKIPHEIHWRWMKNNTLFLHSTLLTWFTVWPSAIHSLASSKHKQPSATFMRIHTHYVQICEIPTELKNARCTAIVYIWSIHNFKAILLDECEWMCIGHIFFVGPSFDDRSRYALYSPRLIYVLPFFANFVYFSIRIYM